MPADDDVIARYRARYLVPQSDAIDALLDVLEAAHAEAEPVRGGCASALRIAVDRALAALRAEVER